MAVCGVKVEGIGKRGHITFVWHLEKAREQDMTKSCKELCREKKIALYGASIWAEIALSGLLHWGGVKPDIVIDHVKSGETFHAIPILNIDNVENLSEYQYIICGSYGFDSIKKTLIKKGVNDIFNMEALIEYADFKMIERRYDLESKKNMFQKYHFYRMLSEGGSVEEIVFEEVYFAITLKCSLACKKCSPLIPYYQDCEKKHYSIKECCDSLARLLECIDGIKRLVLTGGEVFLHPQWDEVVDFCVSQPKIQQVRILTNSTILPADSQLEVLKDKKVDVLLDDYGKYSIKLSELMKKFDDMGIVYEHKDIDYWFDLNDFSCNQKNDKELEDMFSECTAGYCFELHGDGHFHRCVHEYAMRRQKLFPSNMEEGFNVLDSKDIRGDIKDMMFYKKYLEGCKYCPGSMTDRITEIAEQKNKDDVLQ